jgi:hypothetical protein
MAMYRPSVLPLNRAGRGFATVEDISEVCEVSELRSFLRYPAVVIWVVVIVDFRGLLICFVAPLVECVLVVRESSMSTPDWTG